jgi:hypothetical protein
MHRAENFSLSLTSRHLRVCEHILETKRAAKAALPGLRTAKMQTGVGG